jgi:hemolysin type calcium-binding protein
MALVKIRVLVAGPIAVVASLLFAASASAATITPASTSDGLTGCTLRAAIQSANTDADFGGCTHTGTYGADTIQLAAGTIYSIQDLDFPNYGEDANQKGDFDINAGAGLTIQGAGTGANRSTIEGNSLDRIFHILSSSTGPVTISGVILNDGRADQTAGEKGGAILNEGGNLTVIGSDITNNIGGAGGAGIETNGSATTQITDSSFTDNNQCCDEPSSGGGGIDVSGGGGGSLTITNSEIGAAGHANQAQGQGTTPGRGAGIYFAPATNATLDVTASRIVNNAANSSGGGTEGGGVYVGGATGSTVSFTRVLIDSNSSDPITATDPSRGAGVYIDGPGPAVTFTDSLITNNNTIATSPAAAEGSGIYVNSSSGAVRLVGTTVASNGFIGGARSGAGIFNNGTLVLLNSTVAGNSSGTGTGGGLTQAGGTATIVNGTFSGNNANTGSGIAQSGGIATVRGSILDNECAGTIGTGGFNVGSDSTCVSTAGTDLGDAGTHLGALQDNGGPVAGGTTGGTAVAVPTLEPDLVSSDAIDTIPAASCTDDSSNPLTVDQRGFPRPIDGNGDLIDACDSGAVEVPACGGVEATIVGTNGDDTLDGTSGEDVIVGAAGNDTIDGKAGNDTICGGPGNDQITGGPGLDMIFGGPGLDTIMSQDGVSDTINCTGGGPDSGTVDTSPAETYVNCDFDGDGVVDFLDGCPSQAGTNNGCPVSAPPPSASSGPTGQRAAALKKCKKKKSATARKKCKMNANKLPV